jgi:hypothetical protein
MSHSLCTMPGMEGGRGEAPPFKGLKTPVRPNTEGWGISMKLDTCGTVGSIAL